jgi:hypothetical protein
MRTLAEFNGICDPNQSSPSLLRFEELIKMEDFAPRQQDYKPTRSQHLHIETSKKSINLQQIMVNSLKS